MKVITHALGNPDSRQYKTCKCSVCGVERICLPTFDFFGNDGEPLVCETCFKKQLKEQGIYTLFSIEEVQEFLKARSEGEQPQKGD